MLAIRTPEAELDKPYLYRGTTITHTESKLIANPPGDVRLGPGQLLVVMGSQKELARFADLLGPALVDVGAMLG